VTEWFAKAETFFMDFDGVIKESVRVKSDAFEQLFSMFGTEISKKVRNHHEANGGMSRFDKLPIYLDWSGQPSTQRFVNKYSENFSFLVKQKVIDSEWVPGILDFLNYNSSRQFFLITATPQKEIEEIINQLNLLPLFKKIIGSPIKKTNAVKILLEEYSISIDKVIMIGDSSCDFEAAKVNQIPFILRKTNYNIKLQQKLDCPMINNFL